MKAAHPLASWCILSTLIIENTDGLVRGSSMIGADNWMEVSTILHVQICGCDWFVSKQVCHHSCLAYVALIQFVKAIDGLALSLNRPSKSISCRWVLYTLLICIQASGSSSITFRAQWIYSMNGPNRWSFPLWNVSCLGADRHRCRGF